MSTFGQKKVLSEVWIVTAMFILTSVSVLAGSPGDLKPRVPPEHLKEAKSFQNPFTPSADILAKGKKLYEGKAYCSACHGLEGAGGTSGGRVSRWYMANPKRWRRWPTN